MLFLFLRRPYLAPVDSGTGEPAPSGTPHEAEPGPASNGQPIAPAGAPQSQFAQYMGLDLSSLSDQERPIMVDRLKQIDAKFTPAMQEVAELRRVSQQYGMTPTQMSSLVQAIQSNPQVLTQLFNPPAASEPASEIDPLGEIFEAAAVPQVRRVMEGLVDQRLKGTQQQMSALVSTFVEDAITKQATSFLEKHSDYGLTVDQLKDAAMKLGPALGKRPDDPALMAHAAVHALGGLDAIADKVGAAKVQAYIDQSKDNNRVSTPVPSGAPATKAATPPNLKSQAFKQSILGMLNAKEAARK